MTLRPLGDRVLVKPDPRPTETASGLQLAENSWRPEFTGVVVAVGKARHPRLDEALSMADRLSDITVARDTIDEGYGDDTCIDEAVGLLRSLVSRQPLVQPGDRVIFGANVGLVTRIDDERYFVMRESDILAVMA